MALNNGSHKWGLAYFYIGCNVQAGVCTWIAHIIPLSNIIKSEVTRISKSKTIQRSIQSLLIYLDSHKCGSFKGNTWGNPQLQKASLVSY